MIVDTSALIVILRDEVEAPACAMAIAAADHNRLSAANYLEAAIVIDGSRNPIASRRFDDLLREANIVIEPVTEQQANVARGGLPRLRTRKRTSCAAELRRLLCLCAGKDIS